MKKEIVEDDTLPNNVYSKELLISKDRSIENLKKNFADGLDKQEEALNICISENDPKIMKTEFPDEWNFLSRKLA